MVVLKFGIISKNLYTIKNVPAVGGKVKIVMNQVAIILALTMFEFKYPDY